MTGKRVAVLGNGYWGRNIVRNLAELGALAAICDSNPVAQEDAEEKHPGVPVHANEAVVLNDPDIDAIAIATPAATHGDLVRRALEAGKDVFVEKPLCLDIGQAEELRTLAETRDQKLMVGHLLLYHPAFISLRALVERGDLGPLRYIYSNRLSLGKIRREENALWSFAPHDVSMILQLAARLPISVAATGGQYLTDGIADTTLSRLAFDGDVQAHIFVSWLHPFKDQRLVVIGENAMAVFNDVARGPEKLLLYKHKAHWDGEVPVVSKAEAEPISYGEAEPLRNECQTFLDMISGSATPPSDAQEGINVLRVLDACQRSITEGRTVEINHE